MRVMGFGLRYYPVDMLNVGSQKFTKYSYLSAGWYDVIFDMPRNADGEQKDMRTMYKDLGNAYTTASLGTTFPFLPLPRGSCAGDRLPQQQGRPGSEELQDERRKRAAPHRGSHGPLISAQ